MRMISYVMLVSTMALLTAYSAVESATPLPVEIVGKDGAPMVLVPAGPFPMGVPTGDRDGGRDEYPRHEVTLHAFYIDKFEVTHGHYAEFVQATGHRTPQNPKNSARTLWKDDQPSGSLAERPV